MFNSGAWSRIQRSGYAHYPLLCGLEYFRQPLPFSILMCIVSMNGCRLYLSPCTVPDSWGQCQPVVRISFFSSIWRACDLHTGCCNSRKLILAEGLNGGQQLIPCILRVGCVCLAKSYGRRGCEDLLWRILALLGSGHQVQDRHKPIHSSVVEPRRMRLVPFCG